MRIIHGSVAEVLVVQETLVVQQSRSVVSRVLDRPHAQPMIPGVRTVLPMLTVLLQNDVKVVAGLTNAQNVGIETVDVP